MSTGFFIITAALPWLDTPGAERAWKAYWSVGVTRRLVSASLVALLISAVTGSLQAQTTDAPAFGQRAARNVVDAFRFLEQKTNWLSENLQFTQRWIRDGALSYKAYLQSREAYSRLSHGSVAHSFIQSMPTIDVGSTFAGGEEHVRIRPVFRPQDKLPKFVMPQLQTDWRKINLKQLGLDVDRSTIANANPDKGKEPDQLQKESAERAWASWKLAQDGAKVQRQAMIGDSKAYADLGAEEKAHLVRRAQTLHQVALKTLKAYGEDSPQYAMALATYKRALESSKMQNQSAETMAKLRAIDAEAEAQIEKFAAHDQAMRLAALRGDAARENVKNISEKYDAAKGKQSHLIDWLALSPLLETIKQIGKEPGPDAVDASPRGALGQALKQVALADAQAADQQEALKLQARKALEESQSGFHSLAEKKHQVEADTASKRAMENYADKVALLKLDIDDSMTVLGINAMAVHLPPGVAPIVPDRLRAQVYGSLPASRGADAVAENLKSGWSAASEASAKNVEGVLKEAPSRLSLGVLSPIFVGLNRGMKAMTGRSFDLSSLKESKKKMF